MKLTDLPYLSSLRAQALQKHGIDSPEDLLMLFPFRYIDRTRVQSLSSLQGEQENITIIGTIKAIRDAGFDRKKRVEIILQDKQGAEVKGVWFRGGGYFKREYKTGEQVSFFGTVRIFGRDLSMAHPEVERIRSDREIETLKRIVPVYPGNSEFSKARITHRMLHNWINRILEQLPIQEFLPESLLESLSLPVRNQAFQAIHNPETMEAPAAALERFKFEELFLFELSMARLKQVCIEPLEGHRFSGPGSYTETFLNDLLPFQLTNGQSDALEDIRKDLTSGRQMHRLLQGDVGSGKTVVAAGAILMAMDSGYQAVLMAPTEILAEQHYHTLTRLLGELNLEIRLLTGGQSSRLRRDLLTAIEGGACDLVVGTHAVIQQGVRFRKLGLAVVDEQHRFGVQQRSAILGKGDHPHLLAMSATPIPRSLAMTLYSDLDLSTIRELPAGREPVRTAVRTEKARDDLYRFLEQNIDEGGQAYIVYPLVEESSAMDLKDATLGLQKIQHRFPGLEAGLVHGRMSQEEKEHVMGRFYNGELKILVATTVIEVGVDVPNANVMIIEHAERFGLSQLHQLRGRIGRGERQSYCILMPGEKVGNSARIRLKKMVETGDGFEIAETDLKLRGPGDFLGTKQSGLPEFRYADIVEDQWLLARAKESAWSLMRRDPDLSAPEHRELARVFEPVFRERAAWFGLG